MKEDFLPPLKKKKVEQKDQIHCEVCHNIGMFIAILASAVILFAI